MPNQRITSGISASAGMLRTIWMLESSSVSKKRTEPVSSPSASPRPPPMARPASARPALTFTCVHSSPDTASVQAALITSTGAGSTRVDSHPSDEAICHTTIRPTGTSQGTRRFATETPKPLKAFSEGAGVDECVGAGKVCACSVMGILWCALLSSATAGAKAHRDWRRPRRRGRSASGPAAQGAACAATAGTPVRRSDRTPPDAGSPRG